MKHFGSAMEPTVCGLVERGFVALVSCVPVLRATIAFFTVLPSVTSGFDDLTNSPALWIKFELVGYRLEDGTKQVVEDNRQTFEARLCGNSFSIDVFTDPDLEPVEKLGFSSGREIWSLLNKKLHIADVTADKVTSGSPVGTLQQSAMQTKLLGFARPLIGILDSVGLEGSATTAVRAFVNELSFSRPKSLGLSTKVIRSDEGVRFPFQITTSANINSTEVVVGAVICKRIETRPSAALCEMPVEGFMGSPLIFKNGTARVDGQPIRGIHEASRSSFARRVIFCMVLLPIIAASFILILRKMRMKLGQPKPTRNIT